MDSSLFWFAMLRGYILERLKTRLEHTLSHRPLDMDRMDFVCTQDLVFLSATSDSINVPVSITDTLSELCCLVRNKRDGDRDDLGSDFYVKVREGKKGRPKFEISLKYLRRLLEIPLSVATIARLLGVSRHTVQRRITENHLSVPGPYSDLSDTELDAAVEDINLTMPESGYRKMEDALKSRGYRVQMERVRASMHRVDTEDVLRRFLVRRSRPAPGSRSLMHIDTNYKLIRYNMVIFGGIDGYSRKIMYLGVANNNLSATTLAFFQDSVKRFGFPLRVRADEGAENTAVAGLMLSLSQNAFTAGKTVHNQRIESLWRDMYVAVIIIYNNVLHTLEDGGLLDLSNALHMFCCHYVFIPRLQASLDMFREGWDNHPLKTEQNLSPNQMWNLGQVQSPVPEPASENELIIPEIEWESSGFLDPSDVGVQVPVLESPLTEAEMEQLKRTVDPLASSETCGIDLYSATVHCVEHIINTR